jgi:hypothetical protein
MGDTAAADTGGGGKLTCRSLNAPEDSKAEERWESFNSSLRAAVEYYFGGAMVIVRSEVQK